ncbi:MAG: hypothetical protein WCG25_01000 [bacterium]
MSQPLSVHVFFEKKLEFHEILLLKLQFWHIKFQDIILSQVFIVFSNQIQFFHISVRDNSSQALDK